MRKIKGKIDASEIKVNRMKESMQEEEPNDVEPLEDAKREAEAAIVATAAQFKNLAASINEKKAMKDAAKKDGSGLEKELRRLLEELQGIKAEEEKALIAKLAHEDQYKKYEAKRGQYHELYETENEKSKDAQRVLDENIRAAEGQCGRVELEEKGLEFVKALENKCKELSALHKQMEKEYGNATEIGELYDTAKKSFTKGRDNVNSLGILVTAVEKSVEGRKERYSNFQKMICANTRVNFTQRMVERQFRGMRG